MSASNDNSDRGALAALAAGKCAACKPGTPALSPQELAAGIAPLHGWENISGKEIARTYGFKNYYETMAFVNAVAYIAHREDHHPDLEVGYNKCRVRFSTHSVGGLSHNDLICAAKVQMLMHG